MKKKLPLVTRAAVALLATLCICASVSAKKGGGGKPGGGGEDPPPDPDPDPAPMSYVLSWLHPATDGSRLYDIDSDGVAVGNIAPGGIFDQRYGVISFPGRPLIDLETLASSHQDYPAGWRLTAAFRISDGLLISGDLHDPAGVAGNLHCFALQLVDTGPSSDPTISWFRVFSSSDVGNTGPLWANIHDASETGDLAIVVEGGDWMEGFVWSPAVGAPSATSVTGPLNAWRSINNLRQVLGSGSQSIVDADTGVETFLTNSDGSSVALGRDISDNGLAVGKVPTRIQIRKNKFESYSAPARYLNGNWEPLAPAEPGANDSAAVSVNSVDQILGFSGLRMFFFSDDPAVGFRFIDDLLDPILNAPADLALWNSATAVNSPDFNWGFALGDPDASGYGQICGRRTIDGVERAFILTPVTP